MSKWLFMFVVSVFLSEVIMRFNEVAGFLMYVLLISGVLIVLSKKEDLDDVRSKLITILTILPIIRIADLFIRFEFFWRILIFYYLLFFLVSFYCLKFRINPGYTWRRLYLIIVLIIPFVYMGVFGSVLFSFDKSLITLYLLPLIAYGEEVLFRGMIQKGVKGIYGGFYGLLVSSLLYGVFSLGFGWTFAGFMFLAGLISGLVYNYSENIYLVIILNMIVHLFIFVI